MRSGPAHESQPVHRGSPARVLCTAVAMVVVMITASWLTLLANSSDDDSVLEIDPKHLQLGTVWAQDRFPWRVVIRNTSEKATSVKLVSGCTCMEVQPSEFTLDPGEDREVILLIDTRPRSVGEFGRPTFPTSISLTALLKSGGHSATQRWALTGVVRQAILAPGTDIRIPEQFVSHYSNPFRNVLEVSTMKTMGVRRIRATTSKRWLRAKMERLEGERWQLHLATTAAAPQGAVKAAVYLHAETDQGESIPPLRIDVEGELRTWLRPLPRTVDMGVVYAGEDRTVDLQLTTVQSVPFAIDKITAPKNCQVEAIADHPSKKLFRLRCTAAVEGNVSIEGALDVVAIVETPSGHKVECRVAVPVTAFLVGKKK